MKIAVIGAGIIGSTIGARWRDAGHDVAYGSRRGSGDGPGGAPLVPIGEAIAGAAAVLLAVPGKGVVDLLGTWGSALSGTVVIDAVNRIGEPRVNSSAEVAAAAPGARYVRAFNTLGWENFAQPPAGADLFFAADPAARPIAEELIQAVGLRPVLVGGPDASGIVDGLLPLWFALVGQHGGNRRLAFRLVE